MDTQQLILNRNPFAAPTEEAIGADFIGRKSVLKEMHFWRKTESNPLTGRLKTSAR